MDFSKLIKKISKYFENQEKKIRESQVKQFSFFILGFVLFYLLLTGIVSLIPQIFFKTIIGTIIENLLNLQGIVTFSSIGENFVIHLASETKIIITDLCTGTMETIILISAILASFGVKWIKKFQGIIVGIIIGVIFNIFRIWITTNIILTQNIEVAEFTHDTLFRIMLFVYITGFYILWFHWAENGIPKIIKEIIRNQKKLTI
jgi:exosortase/archaeosortase family protein